MNGVKVLPFLERVDLSLGSEAIEAASPALLIFYLSRIYE